MTTTILVGPTRDVKSPFHAAVIVEGSKAILGDAKVLVDPAVYDGIVYTDSKGNIAYAPAPGFTPQGSAGFFGTNKPNVQLIGIPDANGNLPRLVAAYLPGATYPLSAPSYLPTESGNRPFNGLYGKGMVVINGDGAVVTGIQAENFRNASGNGCGIRFQAKNYTATKNRIINCEDGILTSDQPVGSASPTFAVITGNYVSGAGTRDVNHNFGASHALYIHAADRILVKDNETHDTMSQGLHIKIVAGGGKTLILNNKMVQSDTIVDSYEVDLTSSPCVYAGNYVYKGLLAANYGKSLYYSTARSINIVPDTFYGFGNVTVSYIQQRTISYKLSNVDDPDPDTNTEVITGDIFKNVVVYHPNPKRLDASYQPFVLDADPNMHVQVHDNNHIIPQGTAIPVLLTPDQMADIAAVTIDTFDAFYTKVAAGAYL